MFKAGLIMGMVVALGGMTELAEAGVTVIQDFEEDVWFNIGGGSGGDVSQSGVSLNTDDKQVGDNSLELTYTHTTAVGFDFIDFYKDGINIDMAEKNFEFWYKMPIDSNNAIGLELHSSAGGFYEHVFSAEERDGQWHNFSAQLTDSMVFNQISTPSADSINLIRFRSYGDASAVDYRNSFLIDQMQIATIPEPATAFLGLIGMGLMLGRRK